MKKIKILYMGMSRNFGGIEKFLINVCKNLDKEKFEISFLVRKGKKAFMQEELEEMGMKFFLMADRKINYRQHLKDLKKIFSENDFDIIHFNIMNFSYFERIMLANKYSKARLIVHSHSAKMNNMSKKTMLLDKVGRFLTRNIKYDRIACGQKAGEWLFGKKEFFILNNGIEIETFKFNKENRDEIRNEFAIKDNETVIGLVAKMDEQKNHLFLINVFYEYQKLNSNSKLMLIGEGPLKSEIENKVQELNIQDKVLFLGRRDDVNKIYSAMDIFVMPSLFEGLSISIVEAQANGLKCYTSTNVDETSNVTGKVQFLSLLDGAKKWADWIYNSNNERDIEAISKIPNQFSLKENCKILEEYYMNNL